MNTRLNPVSVFLFSCGSVCIYKEISHFSVLQIITTIFQFIIVFGLANSTFYGF